jgi:hypothetical protein
MDGALLGWFDIDGDGRPEIWLETPRYEGSTTQIVRREGRSLRAVSEFGYQYMGDEVEYHEP